MQANNHPDGLAAAITRAASLQTYYTVRFLVDRERVPAAYQAYAYFRWVDDWLDEPARQRHERLEFLGRQSRLIEACCRGESPEAARPEERLVVELIRKDGCSESGLQSYIRNMMAVMSFDAERRGRLISAGELEQYQHSLAVAVTEALHYFIGQAAGSPHTPQRYLAAEGAHIVHMLRDAAEDNALGYFNIPREIIRAGGISPEAIDSEPYRAWVRSRVQQARSYFDAGRSYLAQVESRRCRLAGYAYIARFEAVLGSIEQDDCRLRREYRETKTAMAGARMGWSILQSTFRDRQPAARPDAAVARWGME